jgi:hypothetical protein
MVFQFPFSYFLRPCGTPVYVSLLRTIFVCLVLLFIRILATQSGMQQVKGMVLKSKVFYRICVKKSENNWAIG